jgi:hypothetical protein
MEHIESSIREKIGDKAVRIFRLLNSRGFLEEEQVIFYFLVFYIF